jgi:hypothetical protein
VFDPVWGRVWLAARSDDDVVSPADGLLVAVTNAHDSGLKGQGEEVGVPRWPTKVEFPKPGTNVWSPGAGGADIEGLESVRQEEGRATDAKREVVRILLTLKPGNEDLVRQAREGELDFASVPGAIAREFIQTCDLATQRAIGNGVEFEPDDLRCKVCRVRVVQGA